MIRAAISAVRARTSAAGAVEDARALVAREPRRDSRARSRRRAARRRRVAFGTVPTRLPRVRVEDLDRALARAAGADLLAGDPHRLVRGSPIVSATWLSARSKASKLRQRRAGSMSVSLRLTMSGTRCSETPPCERSGASSPERSWRATGGAEHGRALGDDDEVADPVGRAARRTAPPRRASAPTRCRAARAMRAASAAGVGALGQIDRRERAERAVVDDVGIGDRQDDTRGAAADPVVEDVLQVDDVGLRVHPRLRVHAVVGREHDRAAQRVELAEVAVHHA